MTNNEDLDLGDIIGIKKQNRVDDLDDFLDNKPKVQQKKKQTDFFEDIDLWSQQFMLICSILLLFIGSVWFSIRKIYKTAPLNSNIILCS